MKHILNISITLIIILVLFELVACTTKIERSGVVVDHGTNEPLEGVLIDIYLKHQRRDSLKEKVYTDHKGHFYIREKWSEGSLFELHKSGYISHVNTLSTENDTIKLERHKD